MKEEKHRCKELAALLRRAWNSDPEKWDFWAVECASKRKYTGKDKRIKDEHQCAICKEWFVRGKMHTDHIKPVGSVPDKFDGLWAYFKRLFVHKEQLQKLCIVCHKTIKTPQDRKKGWE